MPIHAGSRMSTALVRPMPPILTGRRACLRARSHRLPAAPTRAPPTSLYSAVSISSSCFLAANRRPVPNAYNSFVPSTTNGGDKDVKGDGGHDKGPCTRCGKKGHTKIKCFKPKTECHLYAVLTI